MCRKWIPAAALFTVEAARARLGWSVCTRELRCLKVKYCLTSSSSCHHPGAASLGFVRMALKHDTSHRSGRC
uniref:Putative secreted peptide n=1 Tax=Anopheles braziliensis TaxID=58242 RepID=A0A2M3ZX03_9DIPT